MTSFNLKKGKKHLYLSFIKVDGTINVDKVLRSIPKKGNEELFEMLSKRRES